MVRSTSSLWAAFCNVCMFLQLFNNHVVDGKGMSICYYRNWAQYYKGKARFLPENIDPHLCSVVNYAAMQVDLDTHKLKGRQRNDDEMLYRLNLLKKKNKSMKVFISVGGWNHENEPRFSSMVKSRMTRKIFIRSVIQYLDSHKLDGINIDWEYPTFRGSPREDKRKFTFLLREMFFAFRIESRKRISNIFRRKSNQDRFHLTLSVSGSAKKISSAYEVRKIARYVDWVDVMAYNLRGPWRRETGCPTLTAGREPTVPGAISMWMKKGMPASKINLGMTMYGRTFHLINSSLHNVGDPATNKGGQPGEHTRKSGILSYYEICSMKWNSVVPWDRSSCGTPFASVGNLWVAFDNPGSIKEKVATLVNVLGLNGVSFWALDFDDFTDSFCGQGRYPLLSAAVDEMKRDIGSNQDAMFTEMKEERFR